MRGTWSDIVERFRKNDLSFYCLLAVLLLSAVGGFIVSVTVQSIIFVMLIAAFSIIFIKKSLKNKKLFLVLLPLAAVFLSYIGADFQVNIRNVSLGLLNAVTAFFIILYADSRNKENVLLTFLFLGLWVSFFLFAQILTGGAGIEEAVSMNINIISGFLLLVYPLALGFAEKNKYPHIFLAIAFVIFLAIVLTKSRAAIILSYAVTVFYFINLKKDKSFKIFFIAVSATVIAGIIYAFYLKSGWSSISERLIWWKTALLMFKDYPFTGIGFGNYGAFFSYYRPEAVLNTLFAHNIFLQILAETGIAGFLCFTAAFYIVANNAIKSFKSGATGFVYKKSAALSVTAFLVFNITEYSFYIPVCLMSFFILCGFLCDCETELRKNGFAYLIIIPAAFAVFAIIPFAIAEQYYKEGEKYAMEKDYIKAGEMYLKAVKYDAKNSEYYHQAAENSFRLFALSSYTEKSRLDDTIEFELRAEKFFSHSAQIKAGLANLHNLKGDTQNAEKYAKAALEADKFNPHYRDIN